MSNVQRTIMKMVNLELEDEENNNSTEPQSDDDDICDSDELQTLFPDGTCLSEHDIARDESYILHVSATLDNAPNVAVGLSDYTVEVYNWSECHLTKLATLSEHTNTSVGVKFNIDNNNLLYTGSSDGTIKLWDLRTPKKSTLKFVDTTEDPKGKKEFASFDISSNNRLVSAGTELFCGEAYILYWDVRNASLLGGYWESHTDDITQLKFHQTNSDRLISGSTDGLINLYNLSKSCEEDALIDCFNTESTIESLTWLKEGNNDAISCITHTADVQLWKIDTAYMYTHFRRNDIGQAMKKKSGSHIYVVGTHETKGYPFLLCGSNAEDGQNIRVLQISDKTLKPAFGFPENKQRVRCSWFNENTNLLLTGGERGILNTWRVNRTTEMNRQMNNKIKSS